MTDHFQSKHNSLVPTTLYTTEHKPIERNIDSLCEREWTNFLSNSIQLQTIREHAPYTVMRANVKVLPNNFVLFQRYRTLDQIIVHCNFERNMIIGIVLRITIPHNETMCTIERNDIVQQKIIDQFRMECQCYSDSRIWRILIVGRLLLSLLHQSAWKHRNDKVRTQNYTSPSFEWNAKEMVSHTCNRK